MSERRVKFVRIAPKTITEFLKSGVRTLSVQSNIPDDAEFMYAYYHDREGVFHFFFRHDSFNETPEGMEVPESGAPVVKEVDREAKIIKLIDEIGEEVEVVREGLDENKVIFLDNIRSGLVGAQKKIGSLAKLLKKK